MGLIHKDLPDAQLHNPKGFASAENESVCYKNASGNLVWATKTEFLSASLSMITGTISGTPTSITNSALEGKSKAVLIVDNIFFGVFTRLTGLDHTTGTISGITKLEDSQIYLILAV